MDRRTEEGTPRRAAARGIFPGYRSEWRIFRDQYARIFGLMALLLFGAAVAGFFYFAANPAKTESAVLALNKSVLAKVPQESSGASLALAIFWNNLRASLIALILGLVPYACLSAVFPVINGGILGLLIFALQMHGGGVLLRLGVDLLPHGLPEISGWLYATTLGVYFSIQMVRRLLAPLPAAEGASGDGAAAPGSRPAAEPRPGMNLFRQVLTSFLRVVIPLLLIAALIEAFLTPLLHRAVYGQAAFIR